MSVNVACLQQANLKCKRSHSNQVSKDWTWVLQVPQKINQEHKKNCVYEFLMYAQKKQFFLYQSSVVSDMRLYDNKKLK